MVFFYLVTTRWIFDVNLRENSISQSKTRKWMPYSDKSIALAKLTCIRTEVSLPTSLKAQTARSLACNFYLHNLQRYIRFPTKSTYIQSSNSVGCNNISILFFLLFHLDFVCKIPYKIVAVRKNALLFTTL